MLTGRPSSSSNAAISAADRARRAGRGRSPRDLADMAAEDLDPGGSALCQDVTVASR